MPPDSADTTSFPSPSFAPLDRLVSEACASFRRHFAGLAPSVVAAAPGRVNLIGEHIDYNDGFVLPIAINRWTVIAAAPVDDNADPLAPSTWITGSMPEAQARFRIDLRERDALRPIRNVPAHAWANYPLGVVDQIAARLGGGCVIPNFYMFIGSTIPVGAGLSSSAALEVAMAIMIERLLRNLGSLKAPLFRTRMDLAHLCQQAEHTFPGVPCGIMDMTISACALSGHALLIDCRSMDASPVRLPDERHEAVILIADSKVKHALAADEYGLRRAQCAQAVETIRATLGDESIQSLRDVDEMMLHRCAANLSALAHKRARHVITENIRVLHAVESFGAEDCIIAGQCMSESHMSLRDDYEVSCAELDTLVEQAWSFRSSGHFGLGVFGSRMTGAGFGGCTVTLCHPSIADELATFMRTGFARAHGWEPDIFQVSAVDGAPLMERER